MGSISDCCHKKRRSVGKHKFEFGETNLVDDEQWFDIPRGNGAGVSSRGRYRNIHEVISTPKPRRDGYCLVQVNGKTRYVHRLLAEAAKLPRRPDQDTVDHKDGNPGNNRIDNLRWASQKEQLAYPQANNPNRKSSAPPQSMHVRGKKKAQMNGCLTPVQNQP